MQVTASVLKCPKRRPQPRELSKTATLQQQLGYFINYEYRIVLYKRHCAWALVRLGRKKLLLLSLFPCLFKGYRTHTVSGEWCIYGELGLTNQHGDRKTGKHPTINLASKNYKSVVQEKERNINRKEMEFWHTREGDQLVLKPIPLQGAPPKCAGAETP